MIRDLLDSNKINIHKYRQMSAYQDDNPVVQQCSAAYPKIIYFFQRASSYTLGNLYLSFSILGDNLFIYEMLAFWISKHECHQGMPNCVLKYIKFEI